jgi:hypothetical protein
MPTYTTAEQRALVLRRLRAEDTKRYSSTGGTADYGWIDDAIVRAEEEFVRLTKSLRTYAIIQLKANQRVYRLPSDMIDIMAAYYYDSGLDNDYKELIFTSIEKMNDEEADWRKDTSTTPTHFYIDRKRGDIDTFGVYPIPTKNGSAISFSNANASELTWLCPLYEVRWDFGRVLRHSSADTFVVSSSETCLVDAEVSDGNILIEYYRLPYQRGEVPKESQKAVSMFAAAELLSDNPEDSAEYKRSQALYQQFNGEVAAYINRRKRPMSGTELRTVPAVWSWQKAMPYYKEIA